MIFGRTNCLMRENFYSNYGESARTGFCLREFSD